MIRPERNPSQSFFEEYQLISNKLKKRFLRKPNVSEASVEFSSLAGRLSSADLPQYAGLCQLARSRCEMTLNNPTQQTAALIAAAQHFSQAVTACPDERPVLSDSLNSHLLTAVSLYNAAARQQLAQQRPQLAAGSCLQLAAVDVTSQQLHSRDAAELLPPTPSINAEMSALRHCIAQGDLSAVESILDSIGTSLKEDTSRPESAVHRKHKSRWEVLELLFVLTIRSHVDQLKPEQRHLLSRFSPESEYRNTDGVMSEDMFVALQSLVMAAARCDLPALYSAESTLYPWLDESQRHLLSLLVQHTELHHVPSTVSVNDQIATRA